MKLIFQYSPFLIPVCLLLGAIYAIVLYRKDRRLVEFPKALVYTLGLLRFLSASVLAILLLSPLVKYISRQISEPIFIIAEDRSESMVLNSDSLELKNSLAETINSLKDELGDDFQLEHYYFGENVRKSDANSNYTDRYTNFEELSRELDLRFENRNVGAMLLVSDGIFNRGMNPLNSFEDSPFPIYTLAKGDTSQRKDLLITNALYNKIAFLGNQFPVRVEYKAIKAKGEKAKIELMHKGEILASENINFDGNNDFGTVDFLVEAKESGLQTYQLRISSIANETSYDNNSQNAYIDILDSRQKILLAYTSPHPDISAIQRAISSSENYKLEIEKFEDLEEINAEYDLLISHHGISQTASSYTDLFQNLRAKKIPILHIVGQSTDWKSLNAQSLPISVSKPLNSLNEVYPIYNDAFPLFKLTDEQVQALKSYPPIKVPQASYTLKDQVYVLLQQQIGNVPTKYPMIVFSQQDDYKEGVMLGEGFWRWRLDNYSRYGSHKLFDQLMTKIVQYMSVKADKSYFRLSHEKEIMENDKLRFDLQLFNKAYDPINDPDAFLQIEDEAGNQFDYQFNRSSNAYFLELSGLGVGNYSYRAYTSFDAQLMEEKGKFSIREIKMESVETVANHNLLFQISEGSGAKMYYDLDLKSFINEIKAREDINSISYTIEDVEDIINLKWIFFLLIFLLSLEWFVRKYQGAY